jgi:branched-chain amino acid transport system permease protein
VNGIVQHAAAGLASGATYALLALALVLVHRTTGVVNFAQGEFATLSAFVCATLIAHGWRFWTAFGVAVVLSFAGGWIGERLLIRPVRDGPPLGASILVLGLLLGAGGLETWIWGSEPRHFAGPFAAATVRVFGVTVARRDLGVAGVSLGVAALVLLLLHRTRTGLGIRAEAAEPELARGLGLPLEGMRAFAWGLAAAIGAVAGVLSAPSHGLEPGMLRGGMMYALAALVIGGLDSPLGVAAAALAVGTGVHVLGDYVHWVDGGLRLAAVLAVTLGVLLVRRLPSGGRP